MRSVSIPTFRQKGSEEDRRCTRLTGLFRRPPPRRTARTAVLPSRWLCALDANCIMVMDNRTNEPNRNEQNSIFITNFQHGETVNYSLVLLKGIITYGACNNYEKIKCALTTSGNKIETFWDVYNREFKMLIDLQKGENIIDLEFNGMQKNNLILRYEPRRTNLRVTPVFIVCQGHDGCFQCPPEIDNSIESACSRIAIGAKIIQSVTAEKLYESGVGRKTFQLEHEVNNKNPECIVFKSSLNVNKARKMKQDELWTHFGRELMLSDLGSNERKFLGFISCTRFKGTDNDKPLTHDEIVSYTEAYAALGGGGLALFGSACLYTWPSTIADIVPKLLDPTPVNTRRFMDDSGYRGTWGGCFATTLGSVLHELGHTFDLGHTKDGIMGRGFDNLDRVFLVGDKRSALTKDNMNNFNGKPVQHSTVSLQRNINVTMNVAEPLRILGPRSKTTLGNFVSMSKSDIVRRSPNVTPITRPSSVYSTITNRMSESKRNANRSNGNDSIYWTRNCAVLLSYHRWFNNEYGRERQAITRSLKFDKNKMLILSTAGIRIVEVRDETSGMVLDSYEFTNVLPEKRFLVPFTFSPKSRILTIIVEDDLGNVLKQTFSY
ncbi:putative zinc metalloproteinase YIL108W [Colias croceus]|uniref:putative zinc metalloproteinase YIL108W n=1 Tax=Colias crocea TaxID=72248 RepID=UPI001E27D893|nr:putative zinc metalloproteinase YIL108W [Colias croceus]